MTRTLARAALLAPLALLVLRPALRPWYGSAVVKAAGRSHEQVLRALRPRKTAGLREAGAAAGVPYPPARLSLVGLKREGLLEVWARAPAEPRPGWRRLRAYPILAASGGPGPKLRQGDLQVPEGIYRLTAFNPNSSYHLSVRVDYPNADDRAAALRDGRTRLGGDIYIHGRAVSIGCLAIGDEAIEELYVLLADVGLSRVRLLLAPDADPRPRPGAPAWLPALYERLRRELQDVRGVRR